MYNHRKELYGDNGLPTFLEAYYGGMEVLRTESDFNDLGMGYFTKAASMNIRYVEGFFDLQAHTRRAVPVAAVMEGFLRAKEAAQSQFDLTCNWILCFLLDMSVESAQETYEQCDAYTGKVFNAIGLDSNEFERPPKLFASLFQQARRNGLEVTAHCDFGQKDNLEHIRQVLCDLELDRIDHGLNAAESAELISLVKARGVGMTLCLHAYNRRNPEGYVMPLIRRLFDEGVKITVNSDDPTYMHGMWVAENLQLVKMGCGFREKEMMQLERNAIEICWAEEGLKEKLRGELDGFTKRYGIE